MDSLLQIRNFQNLLGRELDWSDRARVSAVCKASRGALCDPEALRTHLERVRRSVLDIGRALKEEERVERKLNKSVHKYIRRPLPQDARRLEADFGITNANSSYVVRMAVLLLAFSLEHPQYTTHLNKFMDDFMDTEESNSGVPRSDDDTIRALTEGFTRFGVAYAMIQVPSIGSQTSKHARTSFWFFTPEREHSFHFYYVGFVWYAMTVMIQNFTHESLDPSIERAIELVLEPFARLQNARNAVLEIVQRGSEDVRRIGLPKLTERWDLMIHVLSKPIEDQTLSIKRNFGRFRMDIEKLIRRTGRK